MKKYQNFYLKTFRFFLVVKLSIYLNRRVFVMMSNPENKIKKEKYLSSAESFPGMLSLNQLSLGNWSV